MIAIHHITGLEAIPSHFDNANYITLKLTNKHGDALLPAVLLTLYFDCAPPPGKLWALCDAINRAAPKEPDAITTLELHSDVPF